MRAVELETNIKVRQNILDDGRQNIIQTFCRHIQLNPVGQTVMGAFSDFLDKLIALCDYYLSKKVSSRILRSLFLSSILPKTQRLSALCELKWRKAPSSAFQRLKLETCDVVSTICTWKNQNNDSPACTHLIFCNNKKTFQYFFFFFKLWRMRNRRSDSQLMVCILVYYQNHLDSNIFTDERFHQINTDAKSIKWSYKPPSSSSQNINP